MSAALVAVLLAAGAPGSAAATDARAVERTPCPPSDSLLRFVDAEKTAERSLAHLRSNPDDVPAVEQRIRSLLLLDRWPQALEEARQHNSRHPLDPRVGTLLAEALLRAGRLQESESLLTGLVGKDSGSARARVAQARIEGSRGRLDRAAALAGQAVALAPSDPAVLFRSAELAPDRATTREWLERYLGCSEGDDPDRILAARGTLAALAQLGERRVWQSVDRPRRLAIPLRALGGSGGRPVGYLLEAGVGDARQKPLRLLFDTGSTGLFLTQRAANKRGFEPLAQETTFGGGGGRRHTTQRGLLPRLSFGDLAFADALASALAGGVDPRRRFKGMIGLAPFEGYRITSDLDEGTLVLDADADLLQDGRPYWTFAGQLLVEAGERRGARGLFLLDSGASQTVVSRSFLARVEGATIEGPAGLRVFGGRAVEARMVQGVEIELEGRSTGEGPLPSVELGLRSRLGGVEISGFLGLDLLHGRRISIDTRTRRLAVSEARER